MTESPIHFEIVSDSKSTDVQIICHGPCWFRSPKDNTLGEFANPTSPAPDDHAPIRVLIYTCIAGKFYRYPRLFRTASSGDVCSDYSPKQQPIFPTTSQLPPNDQEIYQCPKRLIVKDGAILSDGQKRPGLCPAINVGDPLVLLQLIDAKLHCLRDCPFPTKEG
jgi:hypothetical protein